MHPGPKRPPIAALAGLALAVLGAWGTGSGASAQSVHALTIGSPGDALDPRNPPFNAIPNDGDNREQLQKWIDAGCASQSKLLYLPPGDWHVTHRPLPDPTEIGSLQISCDGLTILGAGRASRIVMTGSAVLPSNFRGPANWRVFEIRGTGVTIEGIAIDGSERSNTAEQTHLMELVGPARDTELRRLYLNLPVLPKPTGSVDCKPSASDPDKNTRMCAVPGHGSVLCNELGDRPSCSLSDGVYTVLGWFNGGDCIRSGGEIETPVVGVSVTDSYALECSRSFIELQRFSKDFTITGNITKKVSDQIIDQEPTGTGGIGNVLITGNRLERGGASSQGGAAISLTGTGPGANLGDAMVVANNILDGGIITFNVSRISVEHNVINGQVLATNREPVIQINKIALSVRLISNDIDKPAGSGPGPVILASVHNEGKPIGVTIALNTIRQNTDSDAIQLTGAERVTIADNEIQCNQPTVDTFAAISGRSVQTPLAPIDGLIISQNRVQGRCKTLALLSPYINTKPFVPVGRVSITENQTQGLSVGVTVVGPIFPLVKPRISDNLFGGTAPANFVKGPPGFTFDGSNGPQP